MYQNGGLEPYNKVLKTMDFKYTQNENRINWTISIYPYADIFLNSIREIPWATYKFEGPVEYINIETNEIVIKNIKTETIANYCLFGGCVYEILSRRYRNVNLYDFCDPTGDIDCVLRIPKINEFDGEQLEIHFTDSNGIINNYYNNYILWVFNKLTEKIQISSVNFNKMFPNFIDFDINEYTTIPEQNKTLNLGYNVVKIGYIYIVSYLDDGDMFRIQIVCKIEPNFIDHVLELILPLNDENNPSIDSYNPSKYSTIYFSENNKYNVQLFSQLLNDNKGAYTQRLQAYETPKSIHKLINHSARIIYLYELYYRNQEELDLDTKQIFFNFFLILSKDINQILYYKIENTLFQKINIPVKTFINAFLGAYMNPIKPDTPYKVGALNGTRIFLALQKLQLLEVSDNMTIYNTRHEEFLRMILPDKFARGGNKKTRKRNKNKKTRKRNKKRINKKSNRKRN
jgi:hypothetical protein